jgi:Sec-independent protein translocase protein TatA
MPLKEQNSPRSQWISNVSLLKDQLKDGKMVDNAKDSASKLSWNQLEAQLSKRTRDSSVAIANSRLPIHRLSNAAKRESIPVSPSNLNLIPHPHHRSKRVSTDNLSTISKRPTLNIPTSPKSKEILKQVHSGTAQMPNLPARQRPKSLTSNMKNDNNVAEAPSVTQGRSLMLQGDTASFQEITQTQKAFSQTTPAPNNKAKESVADDETIQSHLVKSDFVVVSEGFSNVESKGFSVPKVKSVNASTTTLKVDKMTNVKGSSETSKLGHQYDATIESRTVQGEPEKPCVSGPVTSTSMVHNGADSVTTEQATGSYANFKKKVPRPLREPAKTKGTLSWLRRALKPTESAAKRSVTSSSVSRAPSTCSAASMKEEEQLPSQDQCESIKEEKYFRPTTPLQLGLWLSELQKAIRIAQQEQVQQQRKQERKEERKPTAVVDACPPSPKNDDDSNQQGESVQDTEEDMYYKKNRDIGVYVDYSTFDDGDSVSSMDLLFRWLTCRDLNETDNNRGEEAITPPGTVIATESNVSDDISIDMDVRPTRRTFFSR